MKLSKWPFLVRKWPMNGARAPSARRLGVKKAHVTRQRRRGLAHSKASTKASVPVLILVKIESFVVDCCVPVDFQHLFCFAVFGQVPCLGAPFCDYKLGKCHSFLFTTSTEDPWPEIFIGSYRLTPPKQPKTSSKFKTLCIRVLGIFLDQRLHMHHHIALIQASGRQRLTVLHRFANSVYGPSQQDLRTMHISWIRSQFEHGSPAWFPLASRSQLNKLEWMVAVLGIFAAKHWPTDSNFALLAKCWALAANCNAVGRCIWSFVQIALCKAPFLVIGFIVQRIIMVTFSQVN